MSERDSGLAKLQYTCDILSALLLRSAKDFVRNGRRFQIQRMDGDDAPRLMRDSVGFRVTIIVIQLMAFRSLAYIITSYVSIHVIEPLWG